MAREISRWFSEANTEERLRVLTRMGPASGVEWEQGESGAEYALFCAFEHARAWLDAAAGVASVTLYRQCLDNAALAFWMASGDDLGKRELAAQTALLQRFATRKRSHARFLETHGQGGLAQEEKDATAAVMSCTKQVGARLELPKIPSAETLVGELLAGPAASLVGPIVYGQASAHSHGTLVIEVPDREKVSRLLLLALSRAAHEVAKHSNDGLRISLWGVLVEWYGRNPSWVVGG